jgi:site-specific DNA-methyltransferase (adenine-specific)
MKIELVAIDSLDLDPRNARKHDAKNLKAIADSLEQFGQRKPIVVWGKTVVAGNGTLAAARTLGWSEISIARVPDDWSSDQVKAYALADNRSAELATWDDKVLAEQLLELQEAEFDIGSIGFEIPSDELQEIIEDEIPEQIEPKSKLGQLWKLGRHRLLCGDATDEATVAKLMNSVTADLVFTDPPYGISYQSNMRTQKSNQKFDVLLNDTIFLDIAPNIQKFSNGWIFIWTSWRVLPQWIDKLSTLGSPSNLIIWDKGGGGMGDLEKSFATDFELALTWNQNTKMTDFETALVWHRNSRLTGKRIGSVWSIGKDSGADYAHPTQKPVALAAQAITHTTIANNNVLDLFGGSGSTLIACEQTDRTCFMMELDPKYVDVIIARWEKLTGLTAELIEG